MSQDNTKLKILICGSQKFSDESFVFGMMDQIYRLYNGRIDTVFTSNFSGSCQFVRQWVRDTNSAIIQSKINLNTIKSSDCTFDMMLAKENISLYEDIDIPDFVIQTDPFFQRGKTLLLESEVNMILAFPNKEGVLGPSTENIRRFAKLANLDKTFFDCSKAYKTINKLKEETILEMEKTSTNGFVNRHPGKKI